MNTYKVALTRTYMVTIKAENSEKAARLSEFFIGDCPDSSIKKDKSEFNFLIEDIEMMYNNAEAIFDEDNLVRENIS